MKEKQRSALPSAEMLQTWDESTLKEGQLILDVRRRRDIQSIDGGGRKVQLVVNDGIKGLVTKLKGGKREEEDYLLI